jgi:ribosomal protein S27E
MIKCERCKKEKEVFNTPFIGVICKKCLIELIKGGEELLKKWMKES